MTAKGTPHRWQQALTRATMGVVVAVLAQSVASGSSLAQPPTATPGAQALVGDMARAFEGVTDYQCRVSAHIVKGTKKTDIEGSFYFRRPKQVLLKMGTKGGVVFQKDGKIRAWFLTRLFSHQHHPEDEVLRDVRGRRLDEYVMGDLIADLEGYLEAGAEASTRKQPWRGKEVLALEITPGKGPASFSRRTYWIDAETVLPLGYQTFEGASRVEDVWCGGLKVNLGLKDDFFD